MQSCSFTFWQAAILPLWRLATTFPILLINTFTHRAHIFSLSSQILPQFHFPDVAWGRHTGQQANTGAVFTVSWKRARDILAGPGFQGYPVLHVQYHRQPTQGYPGRPKRGPRLSSGKLDIGGNVWKGAMDIL